VASTFVVATPFESNNDLLKAIRGTGLVRGVVRSRETLDCLHRETILLLAWPHLLAGAFLDRQNEVFNVHNSLLPKYRGRHSLTWAMIHGETETGFSLHQVDAGVDSGPVYAQLRIPIHDEDNINAVFARGWRDLKRWLPEQVRRLAKGRLTPAVQDESRSSQFRARTPEDGLIQWTQPASQLRNLLRALSPPYTPPPFLPFIERLGRRWPVEAGEIAAETPGEKAGQVLEVDVDQNAAVIACADGAVRLCFAPGSGPAADPAFRPGVLAS
jgi:methionyl-tRNA formyltransferase